MEWVPLTDYENGMNLNDRPRKLTQEEITYITDHLPIAPAADSTAAEIARQGTIEWMIETLKDLYIAPSAIPELIQRIIEQHNKSLVVPGTPVGITAAEAVGATTTQMTLNSVAPHEQILIQDNMGNAHLLKIGDWIDELLKSYPSKIQHIPENRTEYLELLSPVTIASPDENGKVSWEKITAVTRHLPVGDLVKITTRSGREVTATQSKSFLVWDGIKLIQTEGKNVKIGDKVPIIIGLSEPSTIIGRKDGIELTYKIGKKFGYHWIGAGNNPKFNNWINEKSLLELIFAPYEFIRGFTKIINDKHISKEFEQHIQYIVARRNIIPIGVEIKENVMLDPIVTVEMIPATEYVYDLTVPTTTNFSLWNGLGIVDTFHASGSAKSASFGIDAMRDLIFARKTPKNESCTIYFSNKRITYEEVLDSRRYIVGSVVSDFIKDYDIDSPEVLERYWWHDNAELLLEQTIPPSTQVLRLFLNVSEMYKHRVTIKELADVLMREIPPSAIAIYGPISDGIIDLYPHPNIIAETLKEREKGIIPPELAELTYLESIVWPELINIRVKGISGIRQLYPIISPVWRMVLLERKLNDTDITNEAAKPILSPYIDNGSGWLLFYNPNIMRISGLIPENLAALCQLAGITIVGGTPYYLIIAMPSDRFRTSRGEIVIQRNDHKYRKLQHADITRLDGNIYREIDESLINATQMGWSEKIEDKVVIEIPRDDIRQINDKFYKRISNEDFFETDEFAYERIIDPRIVITEMKPSEYVLGKVNADKQKRKNSIKELTDEVIKEAKKLPDEERKKLMRKTIHVPRTELMTAAEFVYAETDGSNLKELLSLPGIDKTRTTCNNMYTITATLGIEAAHTFLIRALNNTISNTGSYVHPANIMLIANFITSRGEPYGATYTGISRQPGGHLSLATLERAGKVFTKNALHGRKEDIRNVSASVAVGARMAIGDGTFDIAQDITINGVPKTIINDDLFIALDKDDKTKELAAKKRIIPAQIATVPTEDTETGIEMLKTINIGSTFDFTGAEDETNLITLYNPGEVIPEVGAVRPVTTGTPHKIIRRVQPKIPQQVEIPTNLIDALTQIKIGAPVPEGPEEPEKITITALEKGITQPVPPPQPIISTGLIPLEELLPQTIKTGISDEIETLIERYRIEMGGEEQPIGQITITEELPQTEIPQLPDLTNVDFTQTLIELRREQISELKPIDTTTLKENLTK